LVTQTLFTPLVARRASIGFAGAISATALASVVSLPNTTAWHFFPVLRLIATVATLVALIGFVCDTVHEYGRLWEEHRLMQTLALCDPLTGLANRRACETTLRRELARCEREGETLSMIMLDVDHFKSINDRFGHHAGDRVLVDLAQVLCSELRSSDQAVRWAGDEFIIVLPSTSLEQAQQLAERLRRSVSSTLVVAGDAHTRLTVTLGVAQLRLHDDDSASLIARADANLYEAKRRGRDATVAG